MKGKRKISVRELIKMFTATSYLQEVRLFTFSDIYKYILWCYSNSSDEYTNKLDFNELIDEAQEVIDELLKDGVISYVYEDGSCGLYRVNDKINFLEINELDEDYIKDMNDVLFNIHGGKPKELTLTLSNNKKNNR